HPCKQHDCHKMPCFRASPPLEQLWQKAVDDSAEEDVSGPFGIKIPHLPGHLDEQHILYSFTAKHWNGMRRKVTRKHLLPPDEDILNCRLDTSHERDLLTLEDHFSRQLRHNQSPHIRTNHE